MRYHFLILLAAAALAASPAAAAKSPTPYDTQALPRVVEVAVQKQQTRNVRLEQLARSFDLVLESIADANDALEEFITADDEARVATSAVAGAAMELLDRHADEVPPAPIPRPSTGPDPDVPVDPDALFFRGHPHALKIDPGPAN